MLHGSCFVQLQPIAPLPKRRFCRWHGLDEATWRLHFVIGMDPKKIALRLNSSIAIAWLHVLYNSIHEEFVEREKNKNISSLDWKSQTCGWKVFQAPTFPWSKPCGEHSQFLQFWIIYLRVSSLFQSFNGNRRWRPPSRAKWPAPLEPDVEVVLWETTLGCWLQPRIPRKKQWFRLQIPKISWTFMLRWVPDFV